MSVAAPFVFFRLIEDLAALLSATLYILIYFKLVFTSSLPSLYAVNLLASSSPNFSFRSNILFFTVTTSPTGPQLDLTGIPIVPTSPSPYELATFKNLLYTPGKILSLGVFHTPTLAIYYLLFT